MGIEKDNSDTIYGDEYGNFAAVESGKSPAHALFRPHLCSERTLRLGKVHAYRILDDAMNLAAQGLGCPVNIHTISLDGTIQRVERNEPRDIQ